MLRYKLKLNDAKSELFIVPPKHLASSILLQNPSLRIASAVIQPSPTVKNLGAHLDTVRGSMYYHLRRIRCHPDQQATARAIQATVISCLDYINTLLAPSLTLTPFKRHRTV